MDRSIDKHSISFGTTVRRVLGVWVIIAFTVGGCVLMLPHDLTSVYILTEQLCLIAIGLLGWVLFLREQLLRARAIFLSFFLFGFVGQVTEIAVLFLAPNLSSDDRYVGAYGYQYSTIATLFFFCLSVVNSSIVGVTKWTQTNVFFTAGVIVMFIGVFGEYVVTPRLLYLDPTITDFRIVDRAISMLERETKRDVGVNDIAAVVNLSKWHGRKRVGELSPEEKTKQIERILPYVKGSNYIMLIFKPLFNKIVLVMVFCIFLLFASLGYQFSRDPPLGAYLERIPASLFFFSAFRYAHYTWYAESTDLEVSLREFNVGAGFSILTLITLGILLLLRIKFINSNEGRYYEKGLVGNPSKITRWRDGVDNFVLKHFFENSRITKRFLVIKRRSRVGNNNSEIFRKKTEKTLDKRK